MNKQSSIYKWLKNRLPLDTLLSFLQEKPVPRHKQTFWYYWGGLTLFCFIIQVITGILLTIYYRPTTADAYASVQYMDRVVPFGSMIRSLHNWAANVMIFCVLVHMFSVFFMRAYRKPREMMWLSGFVLLIVTLAFGFTGYLLPWDVVSYFATQVGIAEIERFPLIGALAALILKGSNFAGEETLSRMYVLHIVILPLILIIFLSFHLILNQVYGTSKPIGTTESKPIPYVPDFIYRESIAWLILLAVLVTLSVLIPWGLGKPFDLNNITQAPEGIHPEWYFMFAYQTLKAERYIPGGLITFFFFITSIIWFLIPFLDKRASQEKKDIRFTAMGIFLIFYLAVMTLWGYFSSGGF